MKKSVTWSRHVFWN